MARGLRKSVELLEMLMQKTCTGGNNCRVTENQLREERITLVNNNAGEGGSKQNMDKVGVLLFSRSDNLVSMMENVISITFSDDSKGWDCFREKLEERIPFRGGYDLKWLGPERVLLFTKDIIARRQLLTLAVLFSDKVKICINVWRKDLYTLNLDLEMVHDIWVSVMGLPHYLWTSQNAQILGQVLGQELLEVDKDSLELARLDLLGSRSESKGHWWDGAPL